MDHETKTHSSNRGKGRGRGRGRKKAADVDIKVEETAISSNDDKTIEQEMLTLDLDADITQLEAPTFSTINKGPPEPMLRLKWDHKTHLIGEKVINPMIHCCNKCEAPILIYGRMIPCKHVFCFSCAELENKVCPRCQEKVVRIEKTGLGTVFMCTFGGTRYGNTGCRRTYLSQRDLLAHINHRHVVGISPKDAVTSCQPTTTKSSIMTTVSSRPKPSVTHHTAAVGDPRVQTNSTSDYFYKMHSPSSSSQHSLRQQQSHHHSHLSHHSDRQQQIQTSSAQYNVQHQQSQRHLPVSTPQQLLPSSDYVNQMMVPNYPPPTPSTVPPLPNIRSNLITIQIHDSNIESSNAAVGMPMTPTFAHQSYSSQFPQTSSPGIPYPVPPPGQPAINNVPQTPSQYFPTTPINYPTTSPQRPTVARYSPNSQTQPVINQSQMMSGPSMVPAPRRPQFPGEGVMQPFPVPPPHRWHQPPPNRTPFY